MSKRYIDANKLRKNVEDLHDCYNGFSDTYDKACIIGLIDEQPTADVVERKKGKWLYLDGLDAFECSVCGRQMVRNIFCYCPWCGSDMRKETEDDND